MKIVSDQGMDLVPSQREGLDFRLGALTLTLDGRTYQSGVDIQPDEFYRLIRQTKSFPTTSQPSPGDFHTIYKELAKEDDEILSIHISSGLSGTIEAARQGAAMTEGVKVHFYDTKTLSAAEGWHVEAACRAAKAGWPVERIISLLEKISANSETLYTVATLRYLIHGGRISHIKGLLASVLDIKPIIAVDKITGKYVQRGQARTMRNVLMNIADQIANRHPLGSRLRIQIMHGDNPEGEQLLHNKLDSMYDVNWLPGGPIAPVLGAHTGPGLVGVVFAPEEIFAEVPA